MALNKQGNFTFNHADQQDDLYKVKTAAEIKTAFDSRANELKTTLNALIDALQASTGAAEIGVTVTGLTGNNVKSLIESLKTLVDNLQTQINDTNSDLDLKANISDVYSKLEAFSKTELQSATAGNSGADKIGSSPITGVTGSTVKAQLESLKELINQTTAGMLPDGSVTPEKLSFQPMVKPAGGIPKTDLDSGVQTSLGKADTALQTLPAGSTSQAGILQVTNAVNSTSITTAASPASVKSVNDAHTAFKNDMEIHYWMGAI